MQLRNFVLIAVVAMTAISVLHAQDSELNWSKIKLDFKESKKRKKTKEKKAPNVTVSNIRSVKLEATIKNSSKDAASNLQLLVYILGETVEEKRKERSIAVVEKKNTDKISVEPGKKHKFEAIACDVTKKEEDKHEHGRMVHRVSGHVYKGYVAILMHDSEEPRIIKIEPAKLRKPAIELGLIPEDVKLTSSGMVKPAKD